MTTIPRTRSLEGGDLVQHVDAGRNRDVIRYLSEHQPSCHSDTRDACYRLPQEPHAIALRTGATRATEIGEDWVRFELFRADWPAPDLPFWTLKAYAAARGG